MAETGLPDATAHVAVAPDQNRLAELARALARAAAKRDHDAVSRILSADAAYQPTSKTNAD